jgi:hypothetical protein
VSSQIKARCNRIEKYEEKKVEFYALIWAHISSESEDKVEAHKDYPVFNASLDPLGLLVAIFETHMCDQSGNPIEDRRISRERYAKCQQGPTELLSVFKRRIDDAIMNMAQMECSEITQQDLAADFISKLDNSRFSDLKVSLANNAAMGTGAYPKTLADAYALASSWKVVIHKASGPDVVKTSVFVTSADSYIRSNKKPSSKSDQKDSKKQSGKAKKGKSDFVKNGDHSKLTCHRCNQVGHISPNCPNVKVSKSESINVVTTNTNSSNSVNNNNSTNNNNNNSHIIDGVMFHVEVLCYHAHGGINLTKTCVLFDNQATMSVFMNKNLLTNIRPTVL